MQSGALQQYLTTYQDFPSAGVQFRDISPLLADPAAFSAAIHALAEKVKLLSFDRIVAIDARGFLLGGALAYDLHKGVVLCRKPSKLPGELVTESYRYEYSSSSVSLQKNAVKPGDRLLIVDDVLATGHTAVAACRAATQLGGTVVAVLNLIELVYLEGRKLLEQETHGIIVESVIEVSA